MRDSSTKLKDRHTPRKRFGQNFLTDRNILNKIVTAGEISDSDTVLEIGPGMGHLTRSLAETGAQIVAVELDRDLLRTLRTEFSANPKIHLVEGDILRQSPAAWLAQASISPPYAVVANIPYYITSAIIRYLLEADEPPTRIVLLVQREVAQQIIAKPPDASLLGVSIQYYGTPRVVAVVPAGAFYPRPSVDSAIVRIDLQTRPDPEQARRFFQIVRAGFAARRKQLHNALTRGLELDPAEVARMLRRAGIDPTRRAETLQLQEWAALVREAPLSAF